MDEKGKIESSEDALSGRKGVLDGLDVQVVDRERFEADVMEEVGRKMKEEERERAIKMRVRELKAVVKSLESALEKAKRCERGLRALCEQEGVMSREEVRRSGNLLRDQEEAKEEKERMAKKQKELVEELGRLGHDVEGDKSIRLVRVGIKEEEEVEREEGEVEDEREEETEMERSIRLGEKTAFGKSLRSRTDYDGGERYQSYVEDQKKLNAVDEEGRRWRRKKGEPRRKAQKEKRKEEEEEAEDSVFKGNGTDSSEWGSTDDEGEEEKVRRIRRKRTVDDGDRDEYLDRLDRWQQEEGGVSENHRSEELEGGLRVPSAIWEKLYGYQRVCVQWLWELHQQKVGGILGDEMGLGKTIQIIAFAASMSFSCRRFGSSRRFGPLLIVCPTTVMHQWVQEFHDWWPLFRVAVLHESGSHRGSRGSLIRSIASARGVLVTSYNALVAFKDLLLEQEFQYVILDEGHKIRNPDAQVTLAAKSFQTPHRLILSGSPLQNNLKELWSLFDFIYPGKLGTLPVFMQQFSVPITQGGYSNATRVQVATAYKCATVLRDTINPYLLRRMKADVKQHINLPQKNEQILFCRLTEEQRELYRSYLDSGEIKGIMDGRIQVFVGLINLRKICNHPDLFGGGIRHIGRNNPEELEEEDGDSFGFWRHSAKMIVVRSLLKLWKRQGHRVLLFTQSKQMLRILERFVRQEDYTYLKLDGTTSIGSRQPLISKFNSSPDVFVFLLTTKVGGLGVNLTGASRVVIFDPDWNPSTDTQARERAWRIGQDKQVTIYRLMTAGTIEEKIYHRQIFKQFLINRVLKDPKQKRFFKSNDLYELFTLNEGTSDRTETSAIFAGTGSEVSVAKKRKKAKAEQKEGGEKVPAFKPKRRRVAQNTDVKVSLEKLLGDETSSKEDERRRLLEKVKSISKRIAMGAGGSSKEEAGMREREKKRKRRDKKLDGQRISHLAKMREYKPAVERNGEEDEEEQQHEKKKCSEEQDNYVLSKLLRRSGVHSAVQHDAIVDGDGDDYVLIEGEAERVAKEAVDSLRRSRRDCFRAETGVPSWTGASGSLKKKPKFGARAKKKVAVATTARTEKGGGEEKSTKFDGRDVGEKRMCSADDLLERMRKRNRYMPIQGEGDLFRPDLPGSSSSSSSRESEGDRDRLELLADLRNFVSFQAARDGQSTTAELVARFKSRVPPGESPLFRALLNQICDFHKREKGDGLWTLKAEFL